MLFTALIRLAQYSAISRDTKMNAIYIPIPEPFPVAGEGPFSVKVSHFDIVVGAYPGWDKTYQNQDT